MSDALLGRTADSDGWTLVCFPNGNVRAQFLRHVRLWNLVHQLPGIAAEPLPDGVQAWLAELSPSTTRLIEAFGGRPAGRPIEAAALPRLERHTPPRAG